MIIKRFGDEDLFAATQLVKPVIKVDHVLIKVAATGVNTVDTMTEQWGMIYPWHHRRRGRGRGRYRLRHR
ncbi:MAG: NADPH2:quinone reductase [Paraglaciecola sp.]|jgi:NADPH2:quinone reductase